MPEPVHPQRQPALDGSNSVDTESTILSRFMTRQESIPQKMPATSSQKIAAMEIERDFQQISVNDPRYQYVMALAMEYDQ